MLCAAAWVWFCLSTEFVDTYLIRYRIYIQGLGWACIYVSRVNRCAEIERQVAELTRAYDVIHTHF